MSDPVVDLECVAGVVEVGSVKDEEVFVFIVEALDRVCLSFREIPDVSNTELLDLPLSVLVDS